MNNVTAPDITTPINGGGILVVSFESPSNRTDLQVDSIEAWELTFDVLAEDGRRTVATFKLDAESFSALSEAVIATHSRLQQLARQNYENMMLTHISDKRLKKALKAISSIPNTTLAEPQEPQI